MGDDIVIDEDKAVEDSSTAYIDEEEVLVVDELPSEPSNEEAYLQGYGINDESIVPDEPETNNLSEDTNFTGLVVENLSNEHDKKRKYKPEKEVEEYENSEDEKLTIRKLEVKLTQVSNDLEAMAWAFSMLQEQFDVSNETLSILTDTHNDIKKFLDANTGKNSTSLEMTNADFQELIDRTKETLKKEFMATNKTVEPKKKKFKFFLPLLLGVNFLIGIVAIYLSFNNISFKKEQISNSKNQQFIKKGEIISCNGHELPMKKNALVKGKLVKNHFQFKINSNGKTYTCTYKIK